jgi:hypothetical protein
MPGFTSGKVLKLGLWSKPIIQGLASEHTPDCRKNVFLEWPHLFQRSATI